MPAMIRKFHEAKINNLPSVTLWWDGTPFREFLYSDDMAAGCIHLMNSFSPTKEQNEKGDIFFNIWTGKDISIHDLALMIKWIIWFSWEIIWDTACPNGTPKKLLDVNRIEAIGWKYSTELEDGIRKSYSWFLENY
jgi:GDP-L-fucose synthase